MPGPASRSSPAIVVISPKRWLTPRAERAPRSGEGERRSAAKTLDCAGILVSWRTCAPDQNGRESRLTPARVITVDPAIVLFGLGIGVLVGMTGMGGGSLMTPLLILIFGIQPTTAIGTDIFYSAVTKTVGGWRHFKMKTVNMELVKWLALGSVPAAVSGVAVVSVLQDHIGEERLDSLVYAVLGGTLLMVGAITLARALILRKLVDERDRFEVERRHKVAAVIIGATTGFVIGITSAGSGTVIAILLIAIYRLSPKKVVGTDVFHAAILLWAAGIAHWIGGNVDFVLAANILLGSVPGVVIGASLSDRAPQGFIRTALGIVLMGSGIVTVQKGDPTVWPIAAAVAALGIGAILAAPRWLERRRRREAAEQGADRSDSLAPEGSGGLIN
ncbi:MAG TPA: sulfite exporter TauE/SafE family protein [Solirubrobacterales bacterium]|nr:sulfite exporter TauE/SafE family protein [Solirubrobacterales bacterium]